MPLVLLSIPALALQPVVAPVTTAQTWPVAIPVAITAMVATRPPQMEKSRVPDPPAVEIRTLAVPRFAPITTDLLETARRSRTSRFGDFSLSLDTERIRAKRFEGLTADKVTQHREIGVAGELGIDFAGDRLGALVEAGLEKRPNPIVASNRNFASTRMFGAGFGWSHGGKWRLDLNIQNTTAQAKSAMARLAELASGSARAERKVGAQLTLAPMALWPGVSATFGLEASAGRLTGYDRNLAGGGKRNDNGASLVARLTF